MKKSNSVPNAQVIFKDKEYFVDLKKKIKVDNVPKYNHVVDICQDYLNIGKVGWIVKDIIPSNSIIMIYGDSGSGKSFASIDLCLSMITNTDWHSYDVKKGAPLYIVGEGINGIEKRTKAWFQHHNMDHRSYSFMVTKKAINFFSKDIEELKDDIARMPVPPSLIVIDTFSRAIGDKDENSAGDINDFIKECEVLRDAFNCSVIFIHHTGHSKYRARGSSAIRASIDVEILVRNRNNVISMECTKARDMPEFEPIFFQLEQVEVLLDSDLPNEKSSFQSVVLKPADRPSAWKDFNSALKNKSKGNSNAQSTITSKVRSHEVALDALRVAIELSSTQKTNASGDMKKMVSLDVWKKSCIEAEFSKSDKEDTLNKAFKRVKDLLLKNNSIAIEGEYCYISDDK